MTFILSAQRERWPERANDDWTRYQAYLRQRQDAFPAGAYSLATADWYHDPSDHRCPHDAWLETATFEEATREIRSLDLRVTLLGAYHDLWIDLTYTGVARYVLDVQETTAGHRDWRYDEFRLSDTGHVVHEIEWADVTGTGRWVIEAEDVSFDTRLRPTPQPASAEPRPV